MGFWVSEVLKQAMGEVKKHWPLFVLTVFVFLFRLCRLDIPATTFFDEYYCVYTGRAIFAGDQEIYDDQAEILDPKTGAYDRYRPPLGNLIIGLGIKLWGDNPLGWRFFSVLAGSLLIPLLYFLTLRLSRNCFLSFLVALLLSFDTLLFFHSRTGTIDIFLTFFILAAFYFLVCSLTGSERSARKALATSAFFLGLGLATKWSAVLAWPLFFIFLFLKKKRFQLKELIILISVPLVLYFLAFGFVLPLKDFFSTFWVAHRQMVLFHTLKLPQTATAKPPYGLNRELASFWWSWPLLWRPQKYFFKLVLTGKTGESSLTTQVINVSGNAVIFWAMLPAIFGLFVYCLGVSRRRGLEACFRTCFLELFILLGFLGQWLPWAWSPRPTFLYYFLPAVPFGCLAIAYWLERAWQDPRLKPFALGYLALVIGFFFLLYPTFTAFPIPEKVFNFVKRFG